MNTQANTDKLTGTCPGFFATSLLFSLLMLTASCAHAADSFQLKMLLSPSNAMLEAEARGRVMTYDGLDSATVDQALNEQFDRIDNMMFTRIHHVQEDGDYLVEDDGC